MSKLEKKQVKYQKWINELMGKMDAEMLADENMLEPLYLIGYHHFMEYMFDYNKEEKQNGNFTEQN